MIIYEIITNDIPFSELEIEKAILKGCRPKINQTTPEYYKNLIELCWSENPNERPSFSKIVHELETNQAFISDNININEYNRYIENIAEFYISLNESFFGQLGNIKKIDIKKYRKINKISNNSFSKPYKIENMTTKHTYLCKIFNKEIQELTMKEKEYIINEIQIINQMEHPNILKFSGIDYTDLNGYNKVIYVCEYSPNTSLHDYLNNEAEIEENSQEDKEKDEKEKRKQRAEMTRLQKIIIIFT